MSQIFGQLNSEKISKENEDCRKIVTEIMSYGVNQRQVKYLIYLLALNVEDVDVMRELVGLMKELSPDIFLAKDEDK